MPIIAEHAGHLVEMTRSFYSGVGFDHATNNNQIFKALVTARIVRPDSKLDSIEILVEIGLPSASY